jgi:hypothetical protein
MVIKKIVLKEKPDNKTEQIWSRAVTKKKKKGGGGTVTKETNYTKSLHSRKTQNLRKNIEKKLNPDEAKP